LLIKFFTTKDIDVSEIRFSSFRNLRNPTSQTFSQNSDPKVIFVIHVT